MPRHFLFSLALALVTLAAVAQSGSPASRSIAPATSYSDVPLAFEVNRGQAPPDVQFLSMANASQFALSGNHVAFHFRRTANSQPESLVMQWAGARADSKAVGEDELPGRTNYLVGDREHWLTGIENYRRVRYSAIYPGIDLVYYGNRRNLEYDFEVSPGADPSRVALQLDDSTRVRLTGSGDLLMQTTVGELLWKKPIAYQMVHGKRKEVRATYELKKGQVAFALGAYDHRRKLLIDPAVLYSALIGPVESPVRVAVDATGSAYLLTSTISPEYPTTPGSFMPKGQFSWQPPSLYIQPDHPLAAITKFSVDGKTLLYSTYLGGSQFVCSDSNAEPPNGNLPFAITVDSQGNAIVAGTTDDTNFPVTANAIQKTDRNCSAPQDVFVSKLNATGSALLYSTYLGSTANDFATSVAVDPQDDIFVGGLARTTDFPHTKNFSSCTGTCSDAFVTKIKRDGTLGYSVLFGGADAGPDAPELNALAVDADGHAYFTGSTDLPLPVTKAIQPTIKGSSDVFVGALNVDGTAFDFLTYLGGSAGESSTGIAVDKGGNVYVIGGTSSTDFPTQNAYQSAKKTQGSLSTGFLTKLSPGGGSIVYSTYLGGSQFTALNGVAVGPDEKVYLTGTTSGTDYPVTPDAYQSSTPNGGSLLTVFESTGTALFYSTLFSGTTTQSSTSALSVAVTADGTKAIIAGWYLNQPAPASLDFPIIGGGYNNPHAGEPSNNKSFAQVSAAFLVSFCMNCTSPANISISSPLEGAVVVSPVHFVATGFAPAGVAAMQIYPTPGHLAYTANSDRIDTNLTLAPGAYAVVVQLWDKNGGFRKKTVDIRVENAPPTVVISSPVNGATVSNPVTVAARATVNGTGSIVHMRLYDAPHQAVYDVDSSAINVGLALPQGLVQLTAVAWDSTGAEAATTININVNGGTAGAGVVVSAPTDNASVSSPVHFMATASSPTCPAGIAAMRIYSNPGVSAFTTNGSSLDTNVSLSPGFYYTVVQAWDNCGAVFKSPVIHVNVQ